MSEHAIVDIEEACVLGETLTLDALMQRAAARRDRQFGNVQSYSRKVFIPLTELCRDVCHYCTFAKTPRRLKSAYMTPDAVLAVARAGAEQGCHEALFTLGDKPELRYRAARKELASLGFETTVDYLANVAERVRRETGLLPHINSGVLHNEEIGTLRGVAPSMGLMLESSSERLCSRGMPHYGSPDKDPALRLACLAAAGEQRVPMTTGVLVGIGETRRERLQSFFDLRDLHERYGHLQELIVQNFLPKPGTKMHATEPPSQDEYLWSIAMARLIFPADMNIQAPPNLNEGKLDALIAAGINDWGGVSPLTPDHVNPEKPWPHLDALSGATGAAGKQLTARLTVYPHYVRNSDEWIDAGVMPAVYRLADSDGYARDDRWHAGDPASKPVLPRNWQRAGRKSAVSRVLERIRAGAAADADAIVQLFRARGNDFEAVCRAADEQRAVSNGNEVSYVVTRNINYSNVCGYHCRFCAFSKGKITEELRGAPYVLDLDEIARRSAEAWARGATEVCLQGGIHPRFTGETYLSICRAVKEAAPDLHVHAFSPLEVSHGAATLGMPAVAFLRRLKEAGLRTLPGTAAEILDDDVRKTLCPDKLSSNEWLSIIAAAHSIGLKTTSTIMFGHIETPMSWARHLIALRELQMESGGITEFVPLPFVHMEAPMYKRGQSRPGPTLREAVLMHAVARLALHPHIRNVQVSWTKLGPGGAKLCLAAGANDLGGTLMNESISRAAGASFGQEFLPADMQQLIRDIGRTPRQRSTDYGNVSADRQQASRHRQALSLPVNRPARDYRGEF